jgi:hypothetical protein
MINGAAHYPHGQLSGQVGRRVMLAFLRPDAARA